ncbi:hypothetical protein SteCoe_15427 [Stentor coeruleus]|uniref:Uncharacterized protein n=1 Tax=Stentor coeruleus TaxID=5963 RepID=A0A1R2C3J2_9CILI|nr:hypothetical protein SteCoe_15427 [Stentor coeruleus]
MFQQILLVYLLSLVHSTILIKDFENIILPPNSTLDIRYLDHFEGIGLNFNIEITTEDNKQVKKFHVPKAISDHKSFRSKWPPSSIFREMPTYSNYSTFYSFYFSDGQVGCLKSHLESKSVDQKWITYVDDSKKNLNISGISLINYYNPNSLNLYKNPFPYELTNPYFQSPIFNLSINSYTLPTSINLSNEHLLLILASEYSNITNSLSNILYLANIFNCNKPLKFKSISLPQVSNITQLYLSQYFTTEIVSLSGCDNESAYVYIYNFSNAFNPIFIQRIYENICLKPFTNYSNFPIESLVLQMQNFSYQLIVLDRAYGLESYILTNGIFTVGYDIDMSLYGDLLGFYEYFDPANIQNLALVRTIHGVFTIQTKDMTEISYVVSVDSQGNQTIASGVFAYNGFAYLTFIENNSRLSICSVNLKFPRSTLTYTVIEDKSLNINGQWNFIRLASYLAYIRVDYKKIKVYNCDPLDPILNVFSKDTTLIYKIEAVDLYNDYKSSIFQVFVTTSNMYDVNLTDNGRPYIKPPNVIIDFLISDGILEIPTYMFSGWNLTCGLDKFIDVNNDINDYVTVIDKTPEKIVFYKSLEVKQNITVTYTEGFIVIIDEMNITLINFEDDTFIVYNISNAIQIKSLIIGNEQAFYIISNTLGYCKLFLIYNNTLTHIQSHIQFCHHLLVNKDFLVIGSYYNISIFTIKSISSIEFLVRLHLINQIFREIRKLSMSTLTNTETLLYIGVLNNIGIINLNAIKNKYLTILFPKYFLNYKFFTSGTNNIYVASNEKVIQYDNYIGTCLNTLIIDVNELVELDGYVLAFNDTSVFLIDSNEGYIKNSVIYYNETYMKTLGLLYGSSGNGYIIFANDQTIEIYKTICPKKNSACDNNVKLNVSIQINQHTVNKALTPTISIRCWNKISSLSTAIQALLITYGISISENIYKDDIQIEYDIEKIYKFTDLFSGYDLQAELILNNISVSESNTLPAYINPSFQHNANYHINDVLVTHDIIAYMNFTLVLNNMNNVLLINTNTGNVDGNFSILPDFNATFTCIRIESISTIWPYSLVIVGCNYLTITKQIGLKYIEGSIIISLIIDLDKKTNVSKSETEIEAVPSFTKIIQGTEKTFSLLILDGLDGTNYENNHIWVYKGIWDEFKVNIIFDQTVNYYTLNLDRFYAVSLDGTYDFNDTLNLYVLDYSYGIRALRSYSGMIIQITDGLKLDYPVLSIGLCGRTLFVGFKDTSVMVLMLIQSKMQYYMTYFPYNNASAMYTSLRGFISCSDYYYANYISLPMKNETMIVVRVLNLFSDYASSIVRDIIVTNNPDTISGFYKVGFLNSSSFITLDKQLNELNVFSLQEFSLVFPALSMSQYEDMKTQWNGKTFKMVLHVYNGRSSITTNVTSLTRIENNKTNKGANTKISLWVIFVIICSVVLILIATVISVYRIVMKRKMDKMLERQESVDQLIINVQNGRFY